VTHKKISVFKPDDTVSKVLGVFKESGRYEAVVKSSDTVGIITIRDLLDVDRPFSSKIAGVWRATGFMRPSNTVLDLVEFFIRNKFRAVPIQSRTGLVGISSQTDVIISMCKVLELSELPAKNLLLSPVVFVEKGENNSFARRLMLENEISHIPVLDNGRLVGEITAEMIVHTFISPTSKTTTGERVGKRTSRFPGKVVGIMDTIPFTVGKEASVKDVACGLQRYGKSACYMTGEEGAVLGIITPRELMSVFTKLKVEKELPVYIMGISDEDFFERTVAEGKVRRVIERGLLFRPDITEVSIRIKRAQTKGEKTRFELTARALSPNDQIIANVEGWDLLDTFDELTSTLGKAIRKTKYELPRKRRRRGGR
jgi:CBS domain-containing protein/ribosome-associated translation inhibitor RaiA